jgi:hypothetical protein
MLTFVINGIGWVVKFVPPTHPMLLTDKGTFTLGCCSNDTKTIYISRILSERKMRKVLCHEITHAAMFSYGVELTYDQEELIADIIATYGNEVIAVTNKVFRKIRNRDSYFI